MTRMRLAERRQKLLAAALVVIERRGLDSATTRAIASEAGMPLASFHYAFESHRALLEEAMVSFGEAERERLLAVRLPQASPEEVLLAFLEQHLDGVVAHRDAQLGLLELTNQALRTPQLRELPAAWRRARVNLLAGKIRGSLDYDPSEATPEASDLAEAALTLADGATRRYLETGDEAGTRRAMRVWVRQMQLA